MVVSDNVSSVLKDDNKLRVALVIIAFISNLVAVGYYAYGRKHAKVTDVVYDVVVYLTPALSFLTVTIFIFYARKHVGNTFYWPLSVLLGFTMVSIIASGVLSYLNAQNNPFRETKSQEDLSYRYFFTAAVIYFSSGVILLSYFIGIVFAMDKKMTHSYLYKDTFLMAIVILGAILGFAFLMISYSHVNNEYVLALTPVSNIDVKKYMLAAVILGGISLLYFIISFSSLLEYKYNFFSDIKKLGSPFAIVKGGSSSSWLILSASILLIATGSLAVHALKDIPKLETRSPSQIKGYKYGLNGGSLFIILGVLVFLLNIFIRARDVFGYKRSTIGGDLTLEAYKGLSGGYTGISSGYGLSSEKTVNELYSKYNDNKKILKELSNKEKWNLTEEESNKGKTASEENRKIYRDIETLKDSGDLTAKNLFETIKIKPKKDSDKKE